MHYVKFPKILQPFKCDTLIRVGKHNDGGYLINELDVVSSDCLVSFGIGTDWSFEQQFNAINNCEIYAYDNSVNIDDPFFKNHIKFIKKNIGLTTTETDISLDEVLIDNTNIFLKCDIEGAEYGLLDKLITQSYQFSGMVIEFHNINKDNNLNKILNFISKVSLDLIHLHVNNYFYYITESGMIPDILELSFTSHKQIYDPCLALPNKLDSPNNPNDQEFSITFV